MRPLMLSCVCARVHLCRRVVARVGVGSVLQMWAVYYKCCRFATNVGSVLQMWAWALYYKCTQVQLPWHPKGPTKIQA